MAESWVPSPEECRVLIVEVVKVVSEVGRTVISIYEETDKPHRYHRLPSDLGDRRSLTRAENSDLSVP